MQDKTRALKRDISDRIFALYSEANKINAVIEAIHEATDNGNFSRDVYQTGLLLIINLMETLSDNLKTLSDENYPDKG